LLLARGHRQIGAASFRWAVVFTGAGWFQIFEIDGLVCDTRVFPPPEAPPKALACFELVVRGMFQGFGALEGTFSDRSALVMRHEHYQGADRRRSFAFRAEGTPLVIVEWQAPSEIVESLPRLPVSIALDAEAWDAATRAGVLSQNDDQVLEDSIRALVQRLAAGGLVTKEGAAKALRDPPSPIARLWRALKPTIEHLALSVTASDLGTATDLSTSQVERAFRRWATAFALVGPGLRSVTHTLRMNTAVMFLSAEGASIADVALATGYGSPDALARAFRDAGLEPPTVVQKRLRGT
jgi:AraC-like DNA-binding protein